MWFFASDVGEHYVVWWKKYQSILLFIGAYRLQLTNKETRI